MTINELDAIHEQFLYRWPIERLRTLSIEEYVGIGNKDTFCQWLETKTLMLGSIKGMTSIKFGIYERNNSAKKPMNYMNDDKYSWLRSYGDDRIMAFNKIRSDILNIVELAEDGKFQQINNIALPNLFKWKIAFLYSNERIIPIFRSEVLFKISHHFGLPMKDPKRISEIHELMITNKPVNLNIYHYMWQLYNQFGRDLKEEKIVSEKLKIDQNRTRVAATQRNSEDQLRTTVARSYIAKQRHNKLQKKLEFFLIDKFGRDNVLLEENFVDIKLIQPEYIIFYEIKSASYASVCVRDALGQLLLYSQRDEDHRTKKHIVVGQYPATENDLKYINFIKDNLKVDFDYMHIDLFI
ncbi:hypothetical protein [Chryseobacterium balustinum]|uniref:hypothetical protein n=1 Tax=Chryseobacterium balustinum TaxID=246 RepID=UPI003CFB5E3C